MNPAATQACCFAKRAFPPQFFTTTLTAVSPEAESLDMIDIKSGKELKYRQLIKHTDYTKEWKKSCSNEIEILGDDQTG